MKRESFEKKEITKKSVDFSRWYTDVVLKAELADYAPVKGCMVIRPYGYAIWEKVQSIFNKMIKGAGVDNAYFPLFIPYSLLEKEKNHVEGFSPQLAVVTHGGGEKLAEPLVVRPTSETIMHIMYSKWITSYRDLPLLINQWNNVVRWEKRTYLFLRTTEFLWQEGHTAHESENEAEDFALKALNWYKTLYKDYLAIYPIIGTKSSSEKFAGADTTWAVEALMPDGKALQAATSHALGQNFSKAFDISFQNKKGQNEYVWQTSWGLSTRSIGGLIMAHGDDQGLVLPPALSPIQVVVIPIKHTSSLRKYCATLKEKLEKEGVRVKIDDRKEKTPGWKFNYWELKGVPIRIEIGEKEVEKETITIVRRDNNEKSELRITNYELPIKELLKEIQKNLFNRMKKFTQENTHIVDSYLKFQKIMKENRGLILAFWCEDKECEAKIKEETKATTRVLPLDAKKEKGRCIYCQKTATYRWYFAQAY